MTDSPVTHSKVSPMMRISLPVLAAFSVLMACAETTPLDSGLYADLDGADATGKAFSFGPCKDFYPSGGLISCYADSLQGAFGACKRMGTELYDPNTHGGWPSEATLADHLNNGSANGGYLRIAAVSHDSGDINSVSDVALTLPSDIDDARWPAGWEPQLALKLVDHSTTEVEAEDIGLSTSGGSALCIP